MYHYIFYRLYSASEWVGLEKYPDISATAQITMVEMFLLISLLHAFAPGLNNTLNAFLTPVGMAAVIYGIFYLPNFLIFGRKNRCKRIIKSFGEESKKTRAIGSLLTIVIFIVVLLVMLRIWYIGTQ